LLLLICGVYFLAERTKFVCESTQSTQLAFDHVGFFLIFRSVWSRIGGALTTCLSSFSKLRYPGGFFGGGCFSSTPLSLRSPITPPPDTSAHSTLTACQQHGLEFCGIVRKRYRDVRCSEMTAHRGI